MKKNRIFISFMIVAGILALKLTSCSTDSDLVPMSVKFITDIDKYDVHLAVRSIEAATVTWDYGDGNTYTETATDPGTYEKAHIYTYTASGDYTISVTATGEDGEAITRSQQVTIVASIEEIIAGPDDNGKTWVLTQNEGSFSGKVGPGPVASDLPINPGLIPNDVLGMFGLGDEYDDEFTFYKDGTFEIDIKNNQALAGIIFGSATGLIRVPSADPNQLPLCAIAYQNVTNATWALSYDDHTIQAFNTGNGQVEDVTFTFGEDSHTANLVLSPGAYVGFLDLTYPQGIPGISATPILNAFYIIKEVKPDAIHLAIGMSVVENPALFFYPSMMLHLTLVPKQ